MLDLLANPAPSRIKTETWERIKFFGLAVFLAIAIFAMWYCFNEIPKQVPEFDTRWLQSWAMIPLAGFAMWGVYITLTAATRLTWRRVADHESRKLVESWVRKSTPICPDELQDDKKYPSDSPLKRTLVTLFRGAQRQTPEQAQQVMESALELERQGLHRHAESLQYIGNSAQSAGLLGTVLGLSTSFAAAGALSAAERQEALQAGMAEAMSTTIVGLSIWLAAAFLQHLLNAQVDRSIRRLRDLVGADILDRFPLADLASVEAAENGPDIHLQSFDGDSRQSTPPRRTAK